MPRSRKTNRVPQANTYIADNLSTTDNDSVTSAPSHRRGNPSASSAPPLPHSSNPTVPPHLRGLTNQSTASAGGDSAASARLPPSTTPTTRESASNGPAAQKPSQPVNPARAFPCTFADCEEAFPSEALLLKHKASPMSGHDYCKVCKLDFEDDAAHHLHKLKTPAHITCSICSEDFRSEGGLKRHGLQMHAHEQNIKCRGCGKVFLKGAALMSHIEKNQCPGINTTDFETRRAMVAITFHNMSNIDKRDQDLVSFATSTAADSLGGGVRLEELSLLDGNETPDALGEPMPRFGSDSSGSSPANSKEHPFRNKLYESNFPKPGSEPQGTGKKSIASTSGWNEDTPVSESWVQHNFPNAAPTPAPPGWAAIPPSETGFLSTIDPANGHLGHFRIMDLRRDTLTGHYHCPFMKCPNGPYPTVEMVQEHLNSGVHKGISHRCVGCLRMFKSPSALTAHMESSSERCRVRESREFGNALSLVSGGYLGVNGRHADGSIKIDTPPSTGPSW